jgi:hypothetical protein
MAALVDDDIGPFECPICFNRYDASEHIPCTLPCGHSLCISHVPGLASGSCPECRASLPDIDDIHASISLRDGSLLFWSIVDRPTLVATMETGNNAKAVVSHSTGEQRPKYDPDNATVRDERLFLILTEMMSFDAEKVKRITAEHSPHLPLVCNFEEEDWEDNIERCIAFLVDQIQIQDTTGQRETVAAEPPRVVALPALKRGASWEMRQCGGVSKSCGHICQMSPAIKVCCACADSRPVLGLYPKYVDGQGWHNTGRRDDGYCPACKGR